MKFIFKKPKKSEILIYDRHSKNFAEILFKNKKYEVIDVRYENINLYILLLSLLKFNYFSIKDIYKKIYFETVSPKIIYTSIDNNPAFFKLKHIYNSAVYISDQNGMRNKEFYNQCKNYNSKSKNKLIADYLFSLGNDYKKRLKSIIQGNYFALGNTKNNSFKSKSSSNENIKNITFISGSDNTLLNIPPDDEKIVFKNLISYCYKKKFSLYFLERPTGIGKKSVKNSIKAILNEII